MTGTPGTDLVLINEEFFAESISPVQLDGVLAQGWRHFGTHFYRYSLNLYKNEIRRVIPLRMRLSNFRVSKSQRRILGRNRDLSVENRPIEITAEADDLFHRHKQRFDHGVPSSIYVFLSTEPDSVPCEAREIAVYDGQRLVAVSYFDVGDKVLSGIYAMFDPNEAPRGLGIFTMLKEIEYAYATGRKFYYQGYAYEGESFYDYKKRFSGTEGLEWATGEWRQLTDPRVGPA